MSEAILQSEPPQADFRIAYGSDPNQFGDLRLPPGMGPHPVVIFLHGGFWRAKYDLLHAGHACAALTRRGVATWNLEYRRIGQPGGGWPGTMDDVRAGALLLHHLAEQHNLDLSRVAVAGHSAGGQLALWLAAQAALPLRAVIALAAVSDLRAAAALQLSNGVVSEYMGGSPDEVPERYAAASPIALLPLQVPQWLLHGTADTDVPFAQSEHFARTSINARLVPLTGAGHFEMVDPHSREWVTVEQTILGALHSKDD